MNAPFKNPDRVALTGHTFDAITEAAATAAVYADMAANFASIGDRRGLAYALRCAAAAIVNATEIAASLRGNDRGA